MNPNNKIKLVVDNTESKISGFTKSEFADFVHETVENSRPEIDEIRRKMDVVDQAFGNFIKELVDNGVIDPIFVACTLQTEAEYMLENERYGV